VHGASDFPSDYPAVIPPSTGGADAAADPKPPLWSRGGSCIVGPLGQVLAGPLWDEEGIIYAEVRFWLLH
jgi:predicted amidohydrolase